ncbi:Gfo/Idh/MocA family protein [Terriglobus tenax]|uniref:Gfo/Idh/MocA family protein n=1 Tax=Terriglobus tenax TaxID=1111115 RepID=UPI0021DF7CB8|nr:Gfo/Idh/MocA family oxidoreductase [Terriglobus tenax]
MTWTRREFTKLGAMGTAAMAVPGAFAQAEQRVGFAVIGLGVIADHFMRGARQSQHCRITALVSGHRDKAERIAAEYGVPKESIYSYEEFDRIRDNKAVQAVYVALPNSMHAEYTIRAAKAGKHVFCEKPMAVSSAECRQMIDACKAANVKLMIAYRMQYEPLTLKCIDLVKTGQIGTVGAFESQFGFNIQPGVWRTKKALAGGGSVFDVGIYSLQAARLFTGEEPVEFKAYAGTVHKDDPRFAEMEESIEWTMKFPSGVVASCASSYGAQMEGFMRVHGVNGMIEMGPTFGYDGTTMKGRGKGGVRWDEVNSEKDPKQFEREADHFAECVLNNREPKTPGEEGLRDLTYVEKIYEAAGIKL